MNKNENAGIVLENNPRMTFDGLEILLERIADAPSITEEERKIILGIRSYSDSLAQASFKEPSEESRNNIFQDYIPALKSLLDNATLWEHVGPVLSNDEMTRDKANEFLANPEDYFGLETSEEEKQQMIQKAQDQLVGSSVDGIKTQLEVLIHEIEHLFLVQVSPSTHRALN